MDLVKKGVPTLKDVFNILRTDDRSGGVELMYRYHYNKIYGIAFSVLKNEAASEDVVHNVVRKLLSVEKERLPASREHGWLYTVTKNEALQYLRDNKVAYVLDEIALPITEDKEIRDFVDMDAYYNMIKGLDERRQQIVTLRVLGGYTHREIALMLGKPIGTVQWLYNTAIQQLRISLAALSVIFVTTLIAFLYSLTYFDEYMILRPGGGMSVGGDVRLAYAAILISLIIILVVVAFIIYDLLKKSFWR